MKRVIYIQDQLNNRKYILKDEYKGFGIYEHMTPSGFYVHQEYAITNENITVQIQSYNNQCKEELLDMIDNYNENGKFGIKAMEHDNNLYVMHPSGKVQI